MHTALISTVLLAAFVSTATAAPTFPGDEWKTADPVAAGWSKEKLGVVREYVHTIGSTALMIVQDGRVIASWGDVTQRVRVASIRKSLLSGLYGIAVAEGRIDLRKTLRELDIDDKPPALTDAEKEATIRDLLMARSGVYHEAAGEVDSNRQRRPVRGSHAHGTYWYYNNWDFNALGTIYRQLTDEDIFAAVESRIARPIGMQDFTAENGTYVLGPASVHPAYHMHFTARDLARFGWLYLNNGRWGDRQVVPAAWVSDSTKPLSTVDAQMGYGYMWWVSKQDAQLGVKLGDSAYSARGFGGQYIFVIPGSNLVVVHLHAKQIPHPEATLKELLQHIMAAAPWKVRRPGR
jgi:CubicO group peptidase (beta-lactamase class C family)